MNFSRCFVSSPFSSVTKKLTKISNSSSLPFDSISKCAYKPFDEIPERNVLEWNSKTNISPPLQGQTLELPECGKSSKVFDKMTERNVKSWTAAISNFARSNREDEAIGLFKSMFLEGEMPNYVTVLSVIRAVGMTGSEDLTREIHCFIIKFAFESEMSIATALLGLYSLHEMASVRQLFYQTPTKDLISWSAMIAACSKNGQYNEAIEVFCKMTQLGIEPNNVSLLSVLPACANLGALLAGKQIHGFSIRKELILDTNIQNSLIDMYTKCMKLDSSVLVFDRIKNKDLVSWNTMICGFSEIGCPRKALVAFSSMGSYCLEPDETTVRSTLVACSKIDELKFGLQVHCYIFKKGLSEFASVGTALLKMYADFGDVATAQILFDWLGHKDLIAWSAIVSVHARAGDPNHALEIFKQMQLANEKPNEITLVSLLQACSSMGAHEHGRTIHAHVIRVGYSSNLFITSSLIDLYCKFGKLKQGRALFDNVNSRDLVCWSSMINGYGMNGCGEEAIETFSDMLEYGLKPNDVVLVSLLSACSHCGLVDEGWKLFHSMEEKYGVTPDILHYTCMVDLISRRGKIEEALEFIYNMPIEPDGRVWGTLLAGCKAAQGHVEVAEIAATQLFRDPGNTSYYVFLSNIYAELGRWRDVERLRRVVKKKGLRKTVGYSMVEAM